MKNFKSFRQINFKILTLISLTLIFQELRSQERFLFGIHADPVISWFGSDNSLISNEGARPGFNFGLTVTMPLGSNYSVSSGLSLIKAGGRLVSDQSTLFELKNYTVGKVTVLPGESIVYNIQYISIPVGMKLYTNEIGYITFFSDLGLDPKVAVGGKADIPSLDIKGQRATSEIKLFNLSYHIIAGIEYGIGGNTALVLGLGFENNFFDITTDNGGQPVDRITHKLLSFRMGINF